MGAPAGTTSNLIPSPPSTSDPSTNVTTLNPSNLGTPEDVADNHGNNLTLISTLGGVAPLQAKQHMLCFFLKLEASALGVPGENGREAQIGRWEKDASAYPPDKP